MTKIRINQLLIREQEWLWSDLGSALHNALNGYWSIECEWKIMRIIWIAREVGVTPWQRVSIPLLTSGIYNVIRIKAGFPTEAFDLSDSKYPLDFPENWGTKTIESIKAMDVGSFQDEWNDQ